jgi:hypothetical protein
MKPTKKEEKEGKGLRKSNVYRVDSIKVSYMHVYKY